MGPNSGEAVLFSTSLCRRGELGCRHYPGMYPDTTGERYKHRTPTENSPKYKTGKSERSRIKSARHADNKRARADYNHQMSVAGKTGGGKMIPYLVATGVGGLKPVATR